MNSVNFSKCLNVLEVLNHLNPNLQSIVSDEVEGKLILIKKEDPVPSGFFHHLIFSCRKGIYLLIGRFCGYTVNTEINETTKKIIKLFNETFLDELGNFTVLSGENIQKLESYKKAFSNLLELQKRDYNILESEVKQLSLKIDHFFQDQLMLKMILMHKDNPLDLLNDLKTFTQRQRFFICFIYLYSNEKLANKISLETFEKVFSFCYAVELNCLSNFNLEFLNQVSSSLFSVEKREKNKIKEIIALYFINYVCLEADSASSLEHKNLIENPESLLKFQLLADFSLIEINGFINTIKKLQK